MKFVTRSRAPASTPWTAANLVTKKPWTPRNGTDGQAIFGTCMILYFRPLDLSVAVFQGPVIQKAALPLRKALWAMPLSTSELISPSLFHLSIIDVFLRNAGARRPIADGSRLPALLVPNT